MRRLIESIYFRVATLILIVVDLIIVVVDLAVESYGLKVADLIFSLYFLPQYPCHVSIFYKPHSLAASHHFPCLVWWITDRWHHSVQCSVRES